MSRQIFYMPFSLKFLFLLILILIFGLGSLFLGIIVSAFMKIGFSAEDALLILLLSLLGSGINIPLTTLRSEIPVVKESYIKVFGISYRIPIRQIVRNETVLAINVGGAVIPVLISAYLLAQFPSSLFLAGIGVAVVAAITYSVAKPIRGIGIATPALVPPLTAALTAILLTSVIQISDCPVEPCRVIIAYTGGVLGTLIGADLLNLGKIKKLGAPVASIGGAGTFDGIFLSGFIALLLI
ncbi:hypothetical protein EO98_00130 [Methanosarcina sp. 2.H.T.1A.6]|uniref:DUF1614 domain-containing protein n=1 Tax=unclassified Methanosarcina TaxID=2644672 RepID=UPI0006225191|nr:MULTISPECIES: DUF1614 domain-containing protein [unclassified Methanosarcina]KKG14762.1 hypothetical protein EO94_02425 [Methanosarcina sp. 2.H.T.1A.3]KKG19466.1 hypothetical protein EO97_08725 [Methanosarcina sp. 2.H.T.1A.15]KKG23894.1 hypothetical protein EO98_00130 [Methanosarcina sp. 2.H.T.1A.6]KKG26468.1 hypothetical protein EO96_05970 [Methanosarcina sp. 2.H.T.1A.8]